MTDSDKPRVPPPPSAPLVEPAAKQKGTGGAQRVSLAQAFKLAQQHEAGGRLPQAEQILRKILQAQPHHTGALHLLSVVCHRQGQTELAAQLIEQAIAREPDNPLLFSNHSEVCRVLGRLDQAIASGQKAVSLNPAMAAPLSNIGIAYYDQGDYEKAGEYQRRALELEPDFPAALNNLGSVHRQNKERDAAIQWYRKALEADADYLEAMNNLGAVFTEEERFEEAIEVLIKAYRKRPGYADVHCNLGFAFLGLEQFERARKAFTKAIELRPAYIEAHLGLARQQQEQHQLPQARQTALKALEIDPQKSEVHSMLGSIYTEMGLPEEARKAFDEALRIDPESVRGLVGLGALQMELGALEESEGTFQQALDIDPNSIATRISLTHVRKTVPDDANMQALIEELNGNTRESGPRAASLNFSLGKCYDDIGDYDNAFKHFETGCRLKRASIEYDPADQALLIENLMKYLDKATLERFRGSGDPSDVPIFVLGMPRSGTTLTEQIIASHPQAHGAGELPDLLELAREPRGPQNQTRFPHSMQHLTHADLGLMGARYVAGLRDRNPDALRITDKMPANFLAVGLIHLILPNTRIVHVKRNPVDTCLSCYSRLFSQGQFHSYDLGELGAYYRGYADLMEHWHAVLPEDVLLDVVYEDLVSDNENQARRLIEFCGLEWDDACLQFHEHKRAIRTASVTQVRQPIYQTSVARWKRYEKHLGPLFDSLGDLAPTRQPSE